MGSIFGQRGWVLMSVPWALLVGVGCTNDGGVGAASEAVHDLGVFELEGDADDDAAAGDDWENVLFPPPGDNGAFATTGVLTDGQGQTTFTGGGSKDYLDIDTGPWLHKNGSVPPKDDLEHAFAAAYSVPRAAPATGTDFIVYFGADRFTTNGAAQMGFWFFQQSVDALPDGTFSGEHEIGDLLILTEFTNGGDVSTIKIYRWVGTGGDEGGGTLETVATTGAECGTSADDDACATTNDADLTVSWTSETLGPQSFFEGGVNLTQIFGEGQIPCFASFLAETRSSHEVNATLKDFILGEFQACDIGITKTCDSGTFDDTTGEFDYSFSGQVQNLGGAPLFDVTVYETNGTTDETDDTVVTTITTLAAGATANYSGTFSSTSNGPINNTRVTAATQAGGAVVLEETSADAQCPTVTVTPVITVTKDCTTRLDDSSGQVVVVVDFGGQVCNEDAAGTDGDVSLTDVVVYDTRCTADIADDVVVDDTFSTLGPGACESYSASYTPSSASSDPSLATFTDCVRAVGSTALFGDASDTDDAECSLCPTAT